MPLIRLTLAFLLITFLACPVQAGALPRLQPLIDAAKEGDIITPKPGRYAGPVIIDKAITLNGDGKVTIDSGGKGSVIVLETDGATIRNLRLINSGESHNDIDAGIQVRGDYNVIKDNVIEDCLFGIDLQQSHHNVIRRNKIKSKQFDLGVRGDGIRLWYSNSNTIKKNEVDGARDLVFWYSGENIIAENTVRHGRYGFHFMYALNNMVENNRLLENSVGVFLMYSDSVTVRNNHISHAQGATGMGIGMKETSNVTISGNDIIYCGTGIYLDVSPFQPDTTNQIRNNRIAFNGIGVLFHNDWTGNVFKENRFKNNFVQVSVNAQATAKRNEWAGNYWDDYRGFDRDKDGVGDTPHEMRVYADRVWMDVPNASFFKGSPVLSVLDFLERLAPFTDPIMLLRDQKPQISAVAAVKPKMAPKDDGKLDPFGLKTSTDDGERN